jgi:hypothetical protein
MARRKGRATTEVIGVAPVNFPTGCVLPYAGTTAPEGWLLCDGSAVSRTTYAALYAVLLSAHGNGDGLDTFHIPDLRGRFVRGVDGAANRDPDKGSRIAANSGGNAGNNVGSVQDDSVESHGHTTPIGNVGVFGNGSSGSRGAYGGAGSGIRDLTSTNSSGKVSTETRVKNVNLNHIIKT